MSRQLPAPEEPVAVPQRPRARGGHVAPDRQLAAAQACGGHDQLEGGTRRIGRGRHAVQERLRGILLQRAPEREVDSPDERVGIEGGVAVEQKDLAGPRVQGEHASPHLLREDRVRVLLQRQVETEREVGALLHLDGRSRTEVSHDRAQRAHLHVPDAGDAAQGALVLPLDPVLADDPARLVVGVGRTLQLRLADLPHVAYEMGHGTAGRVMTTRAHLHHRPGEVGSSLLDRGHLREARIITHHQRLVGKPPVLGQQPVDLGLRELEVRGEPPERGPQRVRAPRQQRDQVAGNVLRDDAAVPVVDRAAGSGHRDGPQSVFLRAQDELAAADDLEPKEREQEHGKRAEEQHVGGGRSPACSCAPTRIVQPRLRPASAMPARATARRTHPRSWSGVRPRAR